MTSDIVNDILDLSRTGDVRVDSSGITYKTPTLTVNAVELTRNLVRIAERLDGSPGTSPYR
jgi:hypothetical protein